MERFANFQATTLAQPAVLGDLILYTADRLELSTLADQRDFVRLVLTDAGETLHEVVFCTAANDTALTVQRGMEDTAALDWPAGTKVEHRITAGAMTALWDAIGGN